ncbi:MAG TPA: aminotransferase class I/II-fold pyridoxal phosphate-dependent enzyme [Phycisphaerales bacterium]|nr:aminotransferase class I/II-fold pyridoxal phosphate-dependent enzyme [Phycisphaerales bacterium]HIB01654.1 aminotransferase class I/II-fold pyridoxal phosphate-dependent enzyme [Phycisphaerales bacterium]HIB50696.1 aminotransferase class I/II-fold pyridoxal phosphate-dependent enzyme [Phycisphaerales bacterium]HIN84078.1 aminotransferase class I/II-fold pyridoxal phosphate-dependent enzyme [Phycisphaerales bacterium]HIO52809.1 aminotransferase class I/II-fold pyridoxal phosphate-dependent e
MEQLLSDRVKDIETSGIRRAWALAQACEDPVNLSIGQPDFLVPDAIKQAAIDAILADNNGYTQTAGDAGLLKSIYGRLNSQFDWEFSDTSHHAAMVTTGTAGALTLAFLTVLGPGDEVIIPDPYFVIYPTLARIADAKAVLCDTYPDFRMTADRIAACITDKTKAVLLNSPANPTGVVLTETEVNDIASLCKDRGILLITDEIYDEFVFPPTKHASPASTNEDVLVIRGYGKTYGCTGWRMGYAAGPKPLIDAMLKLKQQTFVCAPSVFQHALVGAYDIDLSPLIDRFSKRRDMVVELLGDVTELVVPNGAFYAFPKIPVAHGLTGMEFILKAIEQDVLVIQGDVFSSHDTHFRISFAVSEEKLEQGLTILRKLLQ